MGFFNFKWKSDDRVPTSASGNARILGCGVSEGGNEVLIRVEVVVPQEQSVRRDLPACDSVGGGAVGAEPPQPPNMSDAADGVAVDDAASGVGGITEESRDEIAEAAHDIKRASQQVQSAAERVMNFEDNLIRESNEEAVRCIAVIYGNLCDGLIQLQDSRDVSPYDELVDRAESVMSNARDRLRGLLEEVYKAEMIESGAGVQYASYSQEMDENWGDIREGCLVNSVRPGVRYQGKVKLMEKVKSCGYRELNN